MMIDNTLLLRLASMNPSGGIVSVERDACLK